MALDNDGPDKNEPVKTREKVKLPWRAIAIASAVFIVVLFAFIWEAVYLPRLERNRTQFGEPPPPSRSEIQNQLNNMDWVEQAFLPINEYSRPGTLLGGINGVVIHYVGNPDTTAMQNRNYFANLAATQDRYASSNFIIGLEGEVVQCVPVDEIAYASVDRNADTLSIELCHPDETGKFTGETYASAVMLTAWLCAKYGLSSDDVIRHYDVTGKLCPLYFVENEDEWDAFKAHVGAAIG